MGADFASAAREPLNLLCFILASPISARSSCFTLELTAFSLERADIVAASLGSRDSFRQSCLGARRCCLLYTCCLLHYYQFLRDVSELFLMRRFSRVSSIFARRLYLKIAIAARVLLPSFYVYTAPASSAIREAHARRGKIMRAARLPRQDDGRQRRRPCRLCPGCRLAH